MTKAKLPKNKRPIAYWLFLCCGMVFVTAVLGAITRLTGSGLSITDWNPIMGTIPPLNDGAWEKAFQGYKAIPQYQVLNQGMTLGEFKNIFFWEWLHRFWDRLIGIVFAVPFLWFLIKRQIDKSAALKLLALFLVGGLQGFVGWFMVESGLAVRTSVSPYRLAMHLALALVLYALMLWFGLDLRGSDKPLSSAPKPVRVFGWATLLLLSTTITWGAFVAGLHAGEAYNTWPLMDGGFLPNAAFTLNPLWINAFENLSLVQFIHRWLGPTTALFMMLFVFFRWRSAKARDQRWLIALTAMALIQVGLGILTLLSHAEIALATFHQAGAICLLTLLLINLWRMVQKKIGRDS